MLTQEELISAIADIIRRARHNKGYTLDRLAEDSETDYSTVNLIENGKQNPRIYTLYKLLYSLNIDIIEILENKNSEISNKKSFILNKFKGMDMKNLEAVDALLDMFTISKKPT